MSHINAIYYSFPDVLYIDNGPQQPSFCEHEPGGIVLRYSEEEGSPYGITVVDLKKNWATRYAELHSKVAAFLEVSSTDVENAVTRAISIAS